MAKSPAGTVAKSVQEPATIIPSVSYDVMPHVVNIADADGRMTSTQRGFMIVRTTINSVGKQYDEYSGQGFAWRPYPNVPAPFADEETARSQMRFHATAAEQSQKLQEVKTMIVEIPYCEVAARGASSGEYHLRLSPDEARILTAVRIALQQMKAQTASGTIVDSDTAALRWLLQAMVKSL